MVCSMPAGQTWKRSRRRRLRCIRVLMRLQTIVCTTVFGAALLAGDARLSPRYETTYVSAMPHGLDQYVASRLTKDHVLWVVLEPESADSVLTDTLDNAFWQWLARTYPPANTAAAANGQRTSAVPRDLQGSNAHKGTMFLVDPRRRLVIWSTYALPKNSSPAALDRTATEVTNQLRAAFAKK